MDRQLQVIFRIMSIVVVILISALVFRQAFSADLAVHPGNQRELLSEYSINRGSIFTADGRVMAESIADGDVYKREYPMEKKASSVSGYWDPVQGRSGLEASYNEWLTGKKKFSNMEDWFSALVNQKTRGNDLTLTIDSKLQSAAWEALGDNRGAIVAMDPRTGAIKALVSKPSYDPNLISELWKDISTDENSPLLNRATHGLYPPGSTFKIITVGAGLSLDIVEPDTKFKSPKKLSVGGGTVENYAGTSNRSLTVEQAFTLSSNTIFAQIGLDVGAKGLVKTARDFGFDRKLDFDLPTSISTIPDPETMDKVLLAWTAVGQGETLVTPLQMGLVASAIANGGNIPQPYLVEDIRNYQGGIVMKHKPKIIGKALDSRVAEEIRKMMVKVVESGTAKSIWTPNFDIAGKTGSAEIFEDRPAHAWFVGFAPADDPKIAVVVIVEEKGLGGKIAAPIAKDIFSEAL